MRGCAVRAVRQLAVGLAVVALVLPVLVAPARLASQESSYRPFYIGEHLTYRIRAAKVGSIGRGEMWIEGPEDVRGTSTYLLRFDFSTRVGIVRAVNRTHSWLDPVRMAALRFEKHERHPLSSHDESVELYPDLQRWEAATGATGVSPTDAPLDELSFIYFIRTLPLTADSVYTFDRHFEAGRNPVTITVAGREVVETLSGDFETLIVEMRVRDPRRYRGEGVIRINISDDPCRLPVRIESSMPVLGKAVLTLESHTHPPAHFAAGAH